MDCGHEKTVTGWGRYVHGLPVYYSCHSDGKVVDKSSPQGQGVCMPTRRRPPLPPGRPGRLWPDPRRGPWLIEATFGTVDGRAECIGVSIRSHRDTWVATDDWLKGILPAGSGPEAAAEGSPDPLPITSQVLRSVPLLKIAADLRQQWADEVITAGRATERAIRAWKRPRDRASISLEDVARVYRDAWTRGASPTLTVADTFHISRSAASKRVARARSAGLLPATRQGRASASEGTRR